MLIETARYELPPEDITLLGYIHAPWEKKLKIKNYPERPLIERDKARTLQAYKFSKEAMNT